MVFTSSRENVCAETITPPDIPCIIQEVSKYIDGVMENVDKEELPHIKFLSPVFNMTSPYYEDLANGFAANATFWNQLDGIAGNAYNFPSGQRITDWVARGRSIPAIGDKPMMLTEIGWYDYVAGGDKGTAQAALKEEIQKLKDDDSILGAQLFNVFNTNPGWAQYAMTNEELGDVCGGHCGKVGANSAGYYSHSMGDFYGPAASHGMQTSIEIANNDNNPTLPAIMPGINDALNNGITPVVRIGVMEDSGGFDDPKDYTTFIKRLNTAVANRPGGSSSDIVYVIVGPNEPETECWASRSCFDEGCAVAEPAAPGACVYSPWTPFCANVNTPQLFCACSGTSCDPFEDTGFVSPNDLDVGQDDGTGKPIFSVYDRDTEAYYDIPPVLFYTSPGANACGAQSAPPPPGSGGGGGAGGGTCNPFNCFRAGVVDFATSLECAANTIKSNLTQPTWYWFDRYGPYCDNETYTLPKQTPVSEGGRPYIMPFGYNFWHFFDAYMKPGQSGGRSCGTLPPSASEIRDNTQHYPTDMGMACPGQGSPPREPGHPAFDYYRGALVDCPLTQPNTTYAAGSFGKDPAALAEYLVNTLKVNYQGRYLSGANPAELLQLLEIAQLMDINPFILLGLWGTESWFGQNGGCSVTGSPGPQSCGPASKTPDSCVVINPRLIVGSYRGEPEVADTDVNPSGAGHGSNQYWNNVTFSACSLNIPSIWMTSLIGEPDGAMAPTVSLDTGVANVCREMGATPQKDYYGLAADYSGTCSTLYMPTIDGISSWQTSRSITWDTGDALIVTGTNLNNGSVYKILYLHLGKIMPHAQSSAYLAGQAFAEMWGWGGNTHVHIEMLKSTDGGATFEFVAPESYICQ